jgi:hypothetical protein
MLNELVCGKGVSRRSSASTEIKLIHTGLCIEEKSRKTGINPRNTKEYSGLLQATYIISIK